jgi:hypothetical protein
MCDIIRIEQKCVRVVDKAASIVSIIKGVAVGGKQLTAGGSAWIDLAFCCI